MPKHKRSLYPQELKFLERFLYCISSYQILNQNKILKNEIAAHLGIFPDKISTWQRKEAMPTARNIIKAVNAPLHFSPLYLFYGIGNPMEHRSNLQKTFSEKNQVEELEIATKNLERLLRPKTYSSRSRHGKV